MLTGPKRPIEISTNRRDLQKYRIGPKKPVGISDINGQKRPMEISLFEKETYGNT